MWVDDSIEETVNMASWMSTSASRILDHLSEKVPVKYFMVYLQAFLDVLSQNMVYALGTGST